MASISAADPTDPKVYLLEAIAQSAKEPDNWKAIEGKPSDKSPKLYYYVDPVTKKQYSRRESGRGFATISTPDGSYVIEGKFAVKKPAERTLDMPAETTQGINEIGNILALKDTTGLTFDLKVETKFDVKFNVIDVTLSDSAKTKLSDSLNTIIDNMAGLSSPSKNVPIKLQKIRFWVRAEDGVIMGQEVFSADGTKMFGYLYGGYEVGKLTKDDFVVQGKYEIVPIKSGETEYDALLRAVKAAKQKTTKP